MISAKEPNILIFFILTICVIWMWSILWKNKNSTLLFYYNLFFTVGFYTPVLYYVLGNTTYSHSFSAKAINTFTVICVLFSSTSIFWMKTRLTSRNFLFLDFFKKFKNNRTSKLNVYFILVGCLMTSYLIVFFKDLPIVSLFASGGGELIDRLDTSGKVPFYIIFSSLFFIIFPNIFFYYYELKGKKVLKICLFIITIFALSCGGNKGILTYFLLFFLLFYSKKKGFLLLKIISVFSILLLYYFFTKGIEFTDTEKMLSVIESPFRRFFVTQPVGFIVRIQMFMDNSLDVNSGYSIKQQIFTNIYQLPLGTGGHPSQFVSSILVEYGYIIMFVVFIMYNFLLLEMIKTSDNMLNKKADGFIIWNLFILMFLTFNSDISVANIMRLVFIFLNLTILNLLISNGKRI